MIFYKNTPAASSFLGLKIQFPCGEDNEMDGFGKVHTYANGLRSTLSIVVRFPPGGMQYAIDPDSVLPGDKQQFMEQRNPCLALRVILGQGRQVTVDGFGMPFSHPGHPADGILNQGAPIAGDITLHKFLEQREFHLLLRTACTPSFILDLLWNKSPAQNFSYPYGSDHSWNVRRYENYKQEMRGSQYPAAEAFDNNNMHVAVVTQSVVQDVLWAAEDAAELFTMKRPAYLVPIERDDDAAEEESFYAIVPFPEAVINRYKPAISNLTKNRTDIEMSYHLDDEVIEIPSISRAWKWHQEAYLTWHAEIIENPQSIAQLDLHLRDLDVVLKVKEPKCKVGEEPLPRPKLKPSHLTRRDAEKAYAQNSENWHIVSLLINPLIEDARRKVNAVCSFLPDAKPTDAGFWYKIVGGGPCVSLDVAFKMRLHRGLVRGTGFYNTLTDPEFDNLLAKLQASEDITAGMRVLSTNDSAAAPRLPSVSLFNFDVDYRDALLSEIYEPDRGRFLRYMTDRPLGLGIMTAPPGFGKTTAMSVATLGMVETFHTVYASAPTHVAVDNFAARIAEIDQRVVAKHNATAPPSQPKRRHKLVIRAYKVSEELEAFQKLLANPKLGDDACPKDTSRGTPRWKLNLSLSFWIMMAMGSSAVRDLDEDLDPPSVIELHKELKDVMERGKLLDFALGLTTRDTDNGLSGNLLRSSRPSTDGMMTPATTASCENGDHEQASNFGDKVKDVPPSMNKAFLALSEENLEGLFDRLAAAVIQDADVLCTTPSLSTKREFQSWRRRARAVAVDEAANMGRADLYTVWGNTLLPCMLGGDDEQLQPAVLSAREERPRGTFLNRHPEDGRVSPLKFLKSRGWPVFRLHWQFRMARGLFDLCHAHVYPDLPFQYAPGCDITLPRHQDGLRLEAYLRTKYHLSAPKDTNTLLPVFFHCVNTETFTDPLTKSRLNMNQVKLALDFMVDLVEVAGISPADMAVISPYKANVRCIKRLREKDKYTPLKPMSAASSVDGFQGQERNVMVIIMGTTESSGPGFTDDKNRLDVAYSRQKSGLVVFGDLRAPKKAADDDDEARMGVLAGMYEYFIDQGRVIEVSA